MAVRAELDALRIDFDALKRKESDWIEERAKWQKQAADLHVECDKQYEQLASLRKELDSQTKAFNIKMEQSEKASKVIRSKEWHMLMSVGESRYASALGGFGECDQKADGSKQHIYDGRLMICRREKNKIIASNFSLKRNKDPILSWNKVVPHP